MKTDLPDLRTAEEAPDATDRVLRLQSQALLACGAMRLLRRYPLIAMAMPALFNALFVGWELAIFLGDTGFTMAAFWLNAMNVAIGELAVLLTLGWLLYRVIKKQRLDIRMFQ